jgi:hypothetical protein
MAQENINYGAFPNDPLANTIRDAFIATQNNFDTLFAGTDANANVSQIVAGTGIAVSPANGVGNVTVTSTFNSLRVRSNTISVSSLGGTVDGNTIIIPSANATLVLELNSNTNANSSLYNLTVTNSLNLSGTGLSSANGNITLTNGNIVLTNGKLTGKVQATGGNGALQFSDANAVMTGTSGLYYDSALSKLVAPALAATQITGGDSNITNGVFTNLVVNTASATSVAVSGNISANNATFSGNISAIKVTGNVSGNLLTNTLANTIVFYSSNGTSTGSANLTYNGSNLTLVNGTIISANFSGNLSGIATSATNVLGGAQPNISEVGNLNYLNVFGNATVNNLFSNGTVSGAQGNFADVAVSNAITATNIAASRANLSISVTAGNITANSQLTTANLSANSGVFSTSVTANRVTFNSQTSAPSSPAGGTVYYNSITGKLQVYNGVLSVWQDLN